ncbi:MAG TPA: crotonase/enoyl-CoA hydratase family protein [Polyangiaceae bacterium]|jgi:enoyl-CoA hydratase|nr:crotonase/enoyl-CoA hydratase family protein [Polyangiaceae bacterium]
MTDSNAAILTTEARGHVLVLTLNRPAARNAFDAALSEALSDALDAFEAASEQRVAVLTGAGGSFSAGMDLKALLRGERAFTKKRGGFGIMAVPPDKPIIAAVEGHAVAGGFELALSCDLIVAAQNARFGLPEVKRGLVAVGGALFRLPRRIPYHVAMELALTGVAESAEYFHRLGLVSRIVPPGEAVTHAVELANVIAANAPLAVAATKRILRRAIDWTEDEAWPAHRDLARPALSSKDAREGALAFAEKRAPRWHGE